MKRSAILNQSVKVASNAWHTLRVEAVGDHFVVTYDGKKVLDGYYPARQAASLDPIEALRFE